MWDNSQPEPINLRNTAPWVRNKFEITMMIQGNNNIIEGEEYKLFENLWVGLNNKMFTPFPIELNNSLINKISKTKYFINYENKLKEWVIEEVDKIIESQIIPTRSNFLLPPQTTRYLEKIIKEKLLDKAIKEVEEVFYSYIQG